MEKNNKKYLDMEINIKICDTQTFDVTQCGLSANNGPLEHFRTYK